MRTKSVKKAFAGWLVGSCRSFSPSESFFSDPTRGVKADRTATWTLSSSCPWRVQNDRSRWRSERRFTIFPWLWTSLSPLPRTSRGGRCIQEQSSDLLFWREGCSMSEADELNTIVAEWVEKAEADLACAAHLLRIKA